MTGEEAALTIPGIHTPRPGAGAAAAPEVADEATARWEAAIFAHARLLYRIAYSVLRHHHDAEDAVQETLQRAWRHRGRFDQIENPAAWLARIVWRVAKSRRSRPGMLSLDALGEVAELRASGAGADELASNRQMRDLMARMIHHLPPKLRQPLLLSTVEELSAREIGLILRIPEASVRTRCLRARRLLREKISAALEVVHDPQSPQRPPRPNA